MHSTRCLQYWQIALMTDTPIPACVRSLLVAEEEVSEVDEELPPLVD